MTRAHTPDPANDDDLQWMTMFSTLEDREVDGLLMGKPTANADLAPLVELVAVLRRSAADEPIPTMAATLRAQLRATQVVPITARQAGRSALFKAGVAAAAIAVVGLGVGAQQNRLPSGLQDVLSSTAGIVGIHVPDASERDNSSSGTDEPAQNGNDDDEPGGGNDNTTGGATPADPGTSGDQAPATPATPPEQSSGTPGDDSNIGGNSDDPPAGPEQSVPSTVPEPPSTVPEVVPEVAPAPEEAVVPVEETESSSGPGVFSSNGQPSESGAEHGVGAINAQSAGQGQGGPPAEPGRPA